jgi:hypothetical protein
MNVLKLKKESREAKKAQEMAESRVVSALTGSPYEVRLSGRIFLFYPISLLDRTKISEIICGIDCEIEEDITDSEALFKALSAGKYGVEIARFISVGSHQRGVQGKDLEREIYEAVVDNSTNEEVWEAYKKVLEQVNPAFFLAFIISLSQQNILKRTKET